jgi:hypothetical protein
MRHCSDYWDKSAWKAAQQPDWIPPNRKAVPPLACRDARLSEEVGYGFCGINENSLLGRLWPQTPPQAHSLTSTLFLDEFDAGLFNCGSNLIKVSSRPPSSSPSTDSSLATVSSDTPERCAKTAWDHLPGRVGSHNRRSRPRRRHSAPYSATARSQMPADQERQEESSDG